MNTPVTFELAKLLKEKGFDVPVKNYYLQKDKGSYLHEGFEDNYWGDNRIVNWNKDIVGIKPFEGFISAPTIAEACMWLYENHGIWIECLHRGDMGDFTFKISKLKKGWRTEPHYIHDRGFNSPTEAYEAAIEYTLKNLI